MKGDKNGVDRIGALCAEAVREHGTDFKRVRAHVDAKLRELSSQDRAKLACQVRAAMTNAGGVDAGTLH